MPAEQQYTVTESIEALGVDPKTFRRWLLKAKITLEKPENSIDDRIRSLTETQLRGLAEAHGRTWPPQPRTPKEQVPVTIGAFKQLVSNLVAPIEQEQSDQAEQIQEQGQQIIGLQGRADQIAQNVSTQQERAVAMALGAAEQANRIQALQDQVSDQAEQIEELEHQAQVHAEQISALLEQTAHLANLLEQIQADTSKAGRGRKPRTAATEEVSAVTTGTLAPGTITGGQLPGAPEEMPSELVGAAEFAEAHGINVGTAKSAYQSGRVPTLRGRWRGPTRQPITVALDATGRARFHELYSGHHDFVRGCPDCQSTTTR